MRYLKAESARSRSEDVDAEESHDLYHHDAAAQGIVRNQAVMSAPSTETGNVVSKARELNRISQTKYRQRLKVRGDLC